MTWWEKYSIDSSKVLVQEKEANEYLEIAEIILSSVSFRYDQNPVLSELSFVARKGELILVKGKSGSGKSTLLNLLLGLSEPDSGTILIDGKPLSREVLKHTGYVGPTPYLSHETIRENLLYGNHRRTQIIDQDIVELMSQLGLGDLLAQFSRGLDELLNEESQLSTGQKQRISLVRAMLRKPKLLILDEFTSNVDSETEEAIIKFLEKNRSDRICIMVTHKDSFDAYATKTIRLT
jgi:ABC-type multidrug transport system fused ATPase/permease subunit